MQNNVQPNQTPSAPVPEEKRLPVYADALLAAWLVFVAVVFWGPFLGFPLPANLTVIGYAVMLMVSVVTLGLGLTRSRQAETLPSGPSTNGKAGAP